MTKLTELESFVYSHRNGETVVPEVSGDEFSHYWFDGIAHYEDWRQIGDRMIVVTGKGADRVVGLVVVWMAMDFKKVVTDGDREWKYPKMIAELETVGYDLDKCEGRWWGPVHVPELSEDLMPSTAAVEDYEEWKKFYPERDGEGEPGPCES